MPETTYNDDDLVYVDPKKKAVVGIVQWSDAGKPQKMEMKLPEKEEAQEDEKPKGRRRPAKKRYYPWGTYRSMKKMFRIEGKEKEIENYKTLDTAIELAVNEPFWD